MRLLRFLFGHSTERFTAARIDILLFLLFTYGTMAAVEEIQKVTEANGLFTKQLYDILAKKEGNVFFSPISVHSVLSMAFAGSKGSTYDAFSKVLNVSDHTVAANGYKDVLSQIRNLKDINLSIANKIYVKDGYKLKSVFQDITKQQYESAVESIDFTKSQQAADNINQWVEAQTNNKIKDLVQASDLDELTRLILLNAIYFKGTWASKFEPSNTRIDKFYINNTDFVDVNMMEKKAKYNYKEDDELDAKIIELPYANPEISMIIILPNERTGIADLEKKLADVDLTKITHNMYRTEVVLRMPKFKIETTIDLNEPLKKLGLDVAFGNAANFSEMLQSPEPLAVSKVIQKAFIEVNEEGTEAAAATSVGFMLTSLPLPPEELTVDHPFLLFLQANTAGSAPPSNLLFAGRIYNPSE